MSFSRRTARQKFPHPSTVGVRHKKAQRKKPVWDDTVNDLDNYKASPEEVARRKEAHRSKNLERVKEDLQERALARVMQARERKSPTPSEKRQLAILKEVLHDKGEFQDVLTKTDTALAMVKDLFGDNPKRYTGFPNVTVAPVAEETAVSYYDGLPRRPELNTSHLEQLSESVMDRNALNEQKDLFSDYEEELGNLNYQPRMDMDRFRHLLAAEQQQMARLEQGTPPKSDGGSIPGSAERSLAINDSLKVKRTKRVMNNKENENSRDSPRKSPTVKQMKDLRKVLGNLENEIAEFERQTGKSSVSAEKQHSNTFSGYTLALVDAVTRLTHYLRESEQRLQGEKASREQLSDEVGHLRQLIDALTSELISCREDYFQLNSEFEVFKRATVDQIQQLQAKVFGEKFAGKPFEKTRPQDRERLSSDKQEPRISPRELLSSHPSGYMSAIPDHVRDVQPALMLSPPRQRDSHSKYMRERPVPEEPGPQLDAQHTVSVTKPVSLVQSSFAPGVTSQRSLRTNDIASQIAELTAEHRRAQARMKQLQDLNSVFGIGLSDKEESSKQSVEKEPSISTRKELKDDGMGDTPRSGDTLLSVESLASDKDDIHRQITELNKQRERAQIMMEKLARQEADLVQNVAPQSKASSVSPAISPIPKEGSIAEDRSVDSRSDDRPSKGIMISLPTVDQADLEEEVDEAPEGRGSGSDRRAAVMPPLDEEGNPW